MKERRPYTKSMIAFFSLFFVGQIALTPCTVAVVSGKVTPDGRPLLWKNRDTSVLPNKMAFLQGNKYSFIGIIHPLDKEPKNVWAGINSEGFAIMNSASSDLAESTGMVGMGENGIFMKRALGECADVADFEKLLDETNGERKVGANFGVIDAKGNACFFETRNSSYVKFDANDPRVAPQGYIVRTNYAYTSPIKHGGGGYIRFERISQLFQTASAEERLNIPFILQEAARDLVNEKLHSYPLSDPKAFDPAIPFYINTSDTINRNSTVSVTLFHGAPSPEKAYLSTMWVLLGQAVCTAAIPLWAHAEGVPEVAGGEGTAPLNDLAIALADYLYPDERGHMQQYLNVTRLLTYGKNGVLDRIIPIENTALEKTEKKLSEWDNQKPKKEEMYVFQKKMADWVYQSLREAFPDIQPKER
ncbi:MAG: hypothetical protein WBE11_01920 [Candidatus Aminicenantaceae bacterium]